MVSLKKKSDFLKLRQEGIKVQAGGGFLIYRKNTLSCHRFAWSFSRYTGSAVQRNRFKRWAREFFKEQEPFLGSMGLDLLAGLKKRNKDFYKTINYEKFCQIFKSALRRIRV